MIKKNLISLFVLIVSIIAVGACFNSAQNPAAIENFTLFDYNGNEHSLSDYEDSLATVILFIATECPVSNAYNERMQNIYEEYAPMGFGFLGINSNKAEFIERIKEHAEEYGITFPILNSSKVQCLVTQSQLIQFIVHRCQFDLNLEIRCWLVINTFL